MMNQLLKHNNSLRQLIQFNKLSELDSLVDLNSIDTVLRKCLSIEDMREAGSFFTGQELSTVAVNGFGKAITPDSVVLDPTCGAGNLLIETSRKLGVKETLSKTLTDWGKILWGFDIHHSFVEATKLRIVLEALHRGVENDCDIEVALSLLPNIQVKDAMDATAEELETVTHAIMNPPFTSWPSPKKNYWKTGNVNAAGIVFDKYLRILAEGCYISAILPDVLRSGSRYQGFRDYVTNQMTGKCDVWGEFNSKTNVDVFILSGVIKKNQEELAWFEEQGDYTPLSELFNVRTGPLVAYREPQEGRAYPFFHPKNSPVWKTITEATETRRFTGTVFQPPIVIVKRTSSPSDRYRAAAAIVNLKEPVAVENHMIVIQPKSGTLRDCRNLLKVLKSEKTNSFLNERIRLRHLTIGAIKSIPVDN